MWETILSASIPAVALIIVQLIVSMKQQRVNDVRFEMTIKEIKDDIKRLEQKQDKHNNFVERVYELERVTDVHEEKLKVADHRIEDLENEKRP